MTIAMQTNDSFTGEFPTPATTLDYGDEFGSAELREKALETRNSSYTLRLFACNQFLIFSDKYYNTLEQFLREFGSKKGKAKFNSWTKSEAFGIPNKMLSLARDFSPWFRNLEKKLQNLIVQNILELNINILKKLITVTPEVIEKILTSGEKITVVLINKMSAAFSPPKDKKLKLRKGGYTQVITPGHRLEGQIGQLQDKADFDNIILLMLTNGREESVKVEDVKPVSKPATQLEQVVQNYKLILAKTKQQLNEKKQKINEKDKEIANLKNLVNADVCQPVNTETNEYFVSQQQIESALIAKFQVEAEIAKAKEIALLKVEADKQKEKEKSELKQQLEEKHQQEMQEKQREIDRLQAQQVEAELAKTQSWQKPEQKLEKMLLESPNVLEQNLGVTKTFLAENTELNSQGKLLLEEDTAPEKVNVQQTIFSDDTSTEQQTTTKKENLETLTGELSVALELLGISGWSASGYRDQNKIVHTGAMAFEVFLKEYFSGNNQPQSEQESVNSSVMLAEYSGRIPTPA